MAMLAEKKRREKWCLNPRGKQWSDDQTKFGQRLLEKMGWSAGQGLGINKQGPTEIVNVKKKDDNKGLGFKENGEEWIKTTSDYNELLDQLASTEGSENDQTDITSSLEDRSKKSKARVHYHKFTRGKDLSRYSEKDLASIIGPDVVKAKSDSDNNRDYNQNQINKGSSTDYFNGKKGVKQFHTPEPKLMDETTNHDDIFNNENVSCLAKKHKKRKKSCNDFENSEEPNCEKEDISKKQKWIEEVDYIFEDDLEIGKKKQTKEKNESIIKLKPIGTPGQFEETDTSLYYDVESKETSKKKKKAKNLKKEDSAEPEIDVFSVQPSKLQNEECAYDKLSKNKKKSKQTHCDLESTINKINDPETTKKVKDIKEDLNIKEDITNLGGIYEEENSLCFVKKHKKRKKSSKDNIQNNDEIYSEIDNGSKKQQNIEEVSCQSQDDLNSLKKKQTKKEKKQTKKETILNQNEAEKENGEQFKIIEPSGQYEEANTKLNVDHEIKEGTKRKNKAKHLKKVDSIGQETDNSNVQPNELLKGTVEENKLENTKKSKKKMEYSVEESVNIKIKKIKVDTQNDEENCETTNDDESNRLNSKYNYLAKESEDKHIKHSKPGKKLKSKSIQFEIEGSVVRSGQELMSEQLDNINEENEIKTEVTTLNDKKGCAKLPNLLLTANGRQTRLRQINKHHNQIKSEKIETEEFMLFNEKFDGSLTESTNCDKWTNEIVESLLPNIYVNPNNHNCKFPASVAQHEYRLLMEKVKELNIPILDVNIIIKNSMSISKKLRKSLKQFYKSKYLKTILPKDVVADIEIAVKRFDSQLQPKINMFNELLELENQTGKLATETQESSNNLNDSKTENFDDLKITPMSTVKKEKLKILKKQLKLLTKSREETVSSVLENNQDIAVKSKTRRIPSLSKYDNQSKFKEDGRNYSTLDEFAIHNNSLQFRIEEKIKTLATQIKLLKEGKKLPIENDITDKNNGDPLIKFKPSHKRSLTRGYSRNNSWTNNSWKEENNQEYFGEISSRNSSCAKINATDQSYNKFESKLSQSFQSSQEMDHSIEQVAFRGQMREGGRSVWGMGFGLGQAAGRGQVRVRESHRGFGRGQVGSRGQMTKGGRGSWGTGYGLGQTSRGRGRTVVRGRISKNNFDAKQYAEKCKTLNKVPEIAFKGVDLKVISGYACDKKETPTIESSSLKKEVKT